MKRIISFLIALLFLSGFVCIQTGCAPSLKQVTFSDQEIANEAYKQREMAFLTFVERQDRLNRVAAPILVAATKIDNVNTIYKYGVSLYQKELFKGEYQEMATRHFGQKSTIRDILPGFPADSVGLKKGDAIMLVNEKLISGMRPEEVREAFSNKSLRLTVQRQGDTALKEVSMYGVPAANYKIRLSLNDTINAYADGENVTVHNGLIRFVENDDELAYVIAHEVAHNMLKHIQKKSGNILLGSILDLLIAGAFGVNTQGTFGQMTGKMYSQEFEAEADYAGVYLAALAGYDVSKGANFERKIAIEHPGNIEKSYAATHPSTPERFLAIERTVKEIKEKQRLGKPLIPDRKDAIQSDEKPITREASVDSTREIVPAEKPKEATQEIKTAMVSPEKPSIDKERIDKIIPLLNNYKPYEIISPTSKWGEFNRDENRFYKDRAMSYMNAREYQLAIKDYTYILQSSPKDGISLFNRGVAYVKSGNYHKGIEDYGKAIKYNSKFSYAFYNRALVYGKLGISQQAVDDLQTVARLGDKSAQSLLNKVDISW
jgi:predicted Zn-dependent protease